MVNASASDNARLPHADLPAVTASSDYEASVLLIVDLMHKGELEQALTTVDRHLRAYPRSRLGHYLRAQTLQAMSGNMHDVSSSDLLSAETRNELQHQLTHRWHHAQRHPVRRTLVPASLLNIGRHEHVLVADLSEGRLYVFRNRQGQPQLVQDYYMSVGSAGYGKLVEGDNKTPIGIYEVNKYIDGKKLPDLYGKGAFPVNYPNRFDQYLGRTGHGIWLHGTPSDTYARAPWSSEGCFVLSNDDLLNIEQYISVDKRTPVILSDTIEWISLDELASRRARFFENIQRWELDWERLDANAVIAHYRKTDFNLGGVDYDDWAALKRGVNKSKKFVQLDLDTHSLFAYPGRDDLMFFRYQQHYYSNNYASDSLKEQYWQRNDEGRWEIIYEGDYR